MQLMLDLTDPEKINDFLVSTPDLGSPLNPAGYVFDAAVWLVRQLVKLASPAICFVHNSIRWVRDVLSRSIRCEPVGYIALVSLRTVIRALRRAQFGTDAVIWATVIIPAELPAVERALDYLIDSMCPIEIPTPGETMQALLQGQIDDKTYQCWMLMRSCDPQVWQPALMSRAQTVDARPLIEYARRNGFSPAATDSLLRERGWIRGEDLHALQVLYDRLPSVGESINWFTHNVDDLKDVLTSGKFAGFDTVDNSFLRWKALVDASGQPAPFDDETAGALIQQWFDAAAAVGQGPTFVPRFGKALRDQGVSEDTIAQNYLANWNLPPVNQLYEMAFRLRPGRVPDALAFSDVQLKRYLAEWKFAPFWWDRLYAISRPVPNLTMITFAFQVGTIDKNEYTLRLGDLGFSDVDSKVLADSREVVAIRQRISQSHGWTPAALSSAYGVGLITDEFVFTWMDEQRWNAKEIQALKERALVSVREEAIRNARRRAIQTATAQVLSSYEVGAMSAAQSIPTLINLGFTPENAAGVLEATDSKVGAKVISTAVRALRSAYLRGELSLDETQAQLNTFGITPERQQTYIMTWVVERTGQRKVAATGNIVKWATEGLLDIPTAKIRLINLGWRDPDLMLLLAEAQQKIQQRQAKAQLAAQKADKAAAKETAKLISDAQKQVKQLQAQLRRTQPLSRLKKWLKAGIVTEDYVRQRMLQSGFSDQAADLYIREWSNGEGPPLTAAQEEFPPT
jgi:hypothetical protein